MLVEAMLNWLSKSSNLLVSLLGIVVAIVVPILIHRRQRAKREFGHTLLAADQLYRAMNLVRRGSVTEYVEREEAASYMGNPATCRRLLITGPSGCGKSRLAAEIALSMPAYPSEPKYLFIRDNVGDVPEEPAPQLGGQHLVLIIDDFHNALLHTPGTSQEGVSERMELATLDPVKNLEGFIEYCQRQADTVTVMVTAQEAPLEEACQRDSRCRRFFEAFERVSLGTPDEQLRRQHWQKLCVDSPLPVPDEATLNELLDIGDHTLRTPEWFVHEHVKVDQSFQWSEGTLEEFTKFRDNPWNSIAANMPRVQQELWRAVYALRALGVPTFPRLVFAFRREAARQEIPGYSNRRVAVAEAGLALQQLATDYMPVVDGRLVIDDIPQEINDQLRAIYAQCAAKALPTALPRLRWGRDCLDDWLGRLAFPALIHALDDLGLQAEYHNLCRAFVRRYRKESVAWFYWGGASHKRGNLPSAQRAWRRAIRLKPDLAEAHNALGAVLWQHGKADEAIAEYQAALRLNPHYAIAHYNVGLALAHQDKTEEAITELRKAVRLNPTLAIAHYNLGVVLRQQGKSKEAIAEFREALAINPDFAEAQLNLGVALHQQDRTEEAVAEYRKALHLNPGLAEAHYNLGMALGQQGKTQQAVAELRQAVRLNPDYAAAHYNLGVALAQEGQTQAAITEFWEAVRINPDDAEAHYNLGVVLGLLGKTQDAITEFREALRLTPGHAKAHWLLALTLYYEQRFPEAKVEAEEAVGLDPSNEQARRVIEELTEKGY